MENKKTEEHQLYLSPEFQNKIDEEIDKVHSLNLTLRKINDLFRSILKKIS